MIEISARISMPAPWADGDRFRRVHNRSAKEALKLALLEYRQGDFKDHFSRPARNRFNHMRRSPKYKAMKRRRHGSITDIVKTGATRDHMLTQYPKTTVKGSAGKTMYGTMYLKFPFPVSAKDETQRGANVKQMRIEISSWDMEAIRRISQAFQRHFRTQIRKNLANSPRLLKKVRHYL